MNKYRFSDKAANIHAKCQRDDKPVYVYLIGEKVMAVTILGKYTGCTPDRLVGVYDRSATEEQINDDLIYAAEEK